MLITRTPFRISFIGGGSDIPEFYREHGGAVISTTINKYVYLTAHPYFLENKILLKYSEKELVDAPEKIAHKIIRQVFTDHKINGVDFSSSADIPSGTGLASSSAFTVGLLNLVYSYLGQYKSKFDLAKEACEVEIEKLREPIGKQDQYACAVGGLNYIQFNRDETVSVEKIFLPSDSLMKLENNLMLFFLGSTRSAGAILTEQKKNLSENSSKIENLKKMVQLTHELRKGISGDIDMLGDILHRGWVYKKELSSAISNPEIDHYYELAMKHGASGGKLLGAGGGGFLLFYVTPDKQQQVANALSDLRRFNMKLDHSGTHVIYYDQ